MVWAGQASEHDSDHGKADEGGHGARVALEVARQASIAADPGEGSLDDPAFGQDDELVQFVSFDDLDDPGSRPSGALRHAWTLIAGIGKDALDEREEAARALVENELRAVAILHVSRVDNNGQQEAERIDEDVTLATRDLLARIKALRVERRAPF